jgi:superfamily II DNA/RNA helicase
VLTTKEREKLQSFVSLLAANQEPDPKHAVVQRLLLRDRWLDRGCIIFSQYYDSIWSLAQQLSEALPQERIGMYAGGHRSGIVLAGVFEPQDREILKHMVQRKEIRLLLGTDAASEGLNLQRLGSLINLDLPWNPTRLEQRKGRIQRIGQRSDRVEMYNMRYQDSVEDRVHELLSERLESIYTLFGQLPDILEDVWIAVAQRDDDRARQTIDAVPTRHPFEDKYHRVGVENVHWESCAHVLSAADRRIHLTRGW